MLRKLGIAFQVLCILGVLEVQAQGISSKANRNLENMSGVAGTNVIANQLAIV